MSRAFALVIGAFFATTMVGCRTTTTAENGTLLDSGSSMPPAARFAIHNELINLPLPEGWGPHPQVPPDNTLGAVNGRYELIVATAQVNMEKARAAGASFEDVLKRLAETRRASISEYATDRSEVEPLQTQMLGNISTLTFRARLSRAPFAGATALVILMGLPTAATEPALRNMITFSFYDYQGSTPDALAAYAKDVLAPLTITVPR